MFVGSVCFSCAAWFVFRCRCPLAPHGWHSLELAVFSILQRHLTMDWWLTILNMHFSADFKVFGRVFSTWTRFWYLKILKTCHLQIYLENRWICCSKPIRDWLIFVRKQKPVPAWSRYLCTLCAFTSASSTAVDSVTQDSPKIHPWKFTFWS